MSLFAIEKGLAGIGGSLRSVKKLRSGDLLLETNSAVQTKSFLLAKTFLNNPVTVTLHRTLNSCRGIISDNELMKSTEEEILGVKAGYIYCKTRLYIPNPIRCFKCQRFGHSKTACRGRQTCYKCASVDHLTSDCQSTELLCANCKQPHSADSKDCPQWKKEKKIQEVRTKQNLSYYEAKKLLFTEQNSMSYSNALKSSTSQPSQTDERLTKVIDPPLMKLKPVKPNVLRVKNVSIAKTSTESPLTHSAAQSKIKKHSQNAKQAKASDQWELVKESKAAKKARLLAERRGHVLQSLSRSRSLTREDFLKNPKSKLDEHVDSDLVLSVHPSDDDMSTSDMEDSSPASANS
ncbi:hypothetical protein AVEN_230202-1 [Araneus ventricosus]|uniref:CCHC-type domain-containing protein n=1 Tax=Araneus ventricosus TaxID=182803 RepID=A0A4Y2VBM9_ARAVE|nr:hypothetical protein AVEN_230202-1 [Araneus ventricosus]